MAKFLDSAGMKTVLMKVKEEIDAAKSGVLGTKATSTKLGLVMPGTNMSVGSDGKLNVPTGSATALGVLKVGSNLKVASGTVSVDTDTVALKSDVSSAVSALVGGAPETLDTLKEIADALGSDANLSATLTSELGKKANSADVYSKTSADSTFLKASGVVALTAAEINSTLAEVWPTAAS
ncbi:MAG: hypothetical protein K2F87_00065 [Muribaculaceae bacterium]|nr:hypothetical protein [Muribaculaceae bacterium]